MAGLEYAAMGGTRILDANKAIVSVANFFEATSQIAQTTLRSVLGQQVWQLV